MALLLFTCLLFLFNLSPAQNDMGVNIENVINDLASQGYSEGEVRNAVESLSNEGHVYSTIDENHFQVAE